MDEQEVTRVAEKITQALRIRVTLIQENNRAFALLGEERIQKQVDGLLLFERTLAREKQVLEILERGAVEEISLLDSFLRSRSADCLSHESKNLVESIRKILHAFLHKSIPKIERRIEAEESFLGESNSLKQAWHMMQLKKRWKSELISDYDNIYRMIDFGKAEKAFTFWQWVYDKTINLPEHIKKFSQDVHTIPEEIMQRQLIVAFRDNNIWPFLIANPLMFAYLKFAPPTDDFEKAIWASVIWSLSGFFTRVGHILIQFNQIYKLADVMYKTDAISNLQPKNIFAAQALLKQHS
jgi:hypothetical protein